MATSGRPVSARSGGTISSTRSATRCGTSTGRTSPDATVAPRRVGLGAPPSARGMPKRSDGSGTANSTRTTEMPDTTTPAMDRPREIDWPLCRYVAIDVEGTASPAGQPEGLVEVAAVEFSLDQPPGRTVHTLLDSGLPITAIGTRIHGLRGRDVAGQPTLASVCPRLAGLIDGAVVVAHNARVDWGLVHRDCPELRPVAAVDTLRISRTLWP